jgi:sulfur carrier protein
VHVTLSVVGGETREFEVTDATYGDLLAELELSPQEASVLVDGRPVPADREVDATEAEVLRLVKGG